MIIINADDWGRSSHDTDAATELLRTGTVTSVSAMVFMEDSERAARVANQMGLDVGLHLNFCERWNGGGASPEIVAEHQSLVAFLNRGRYAQLLYHPRLRTAFKTVYRAQIEEFHRLYGRPPSHIDGHRHLHLCANMLIDALIPRGFGVRRSFTFAAGEKGILNRAYRRAVDARLERRYLVTDYFFSLEQCLKGIGRPLSRVVDLAKMANVEVMTHPRNALEFDCLHGPQCIEMLRTVTKGTYAELSGRN